VLLELYKKQDGILYYWQTWDKNPKSGFINWGIVGEKGSREIIRAKNKSDFELLIQARITEKREEGFAEPVTKDVLVIEYEAENMTTNKLELLASISQLFTKKNVMLSLSKHLYRFVV